MLTRACIGYATAERDRSRRARLRSRYPRGVVRRFQNAELTSGKRRMKVGPAPSLDRAATVVRLLDELREMGARVSTVPVRDANGAVAAAEETLGFALPAEYSASAALAKTKEYATELDYPKRFVVLRDEGEHSNIACGHVYDDDLKAIVTTAGGDAIDLDVDVRLIDYWTFLVTELKNVRDRYADD
jgi:hypothetical protein